MSTATEYRELLVRFLPHPIRSDADYRRSLVQLERLMVPRPTAARSQLIEVLATLVERYESRDYPTPECNSADVLKNLLDAKGVYVLDVMTPYTEHVLPMIPSGMTYKDIITKPIRNEDGTKGFGDIKVATAL